MKINSPILTRMQAMSLFFFFAFIFVLANSELSAQPHFNNSSFSGLWIAYDSTQQERDTLYMISDGNGNILDCNTFHFSSQNSFYSVQENGAITIGLHMEHDGLMEFNGFLLSSTEGSIAIEFDDGALSFDLKKVSDKSVLQGTWFGAFDSRDVRFTVDADGEVSSFSGFENPVSGRIYAQNGFVAGFIESAEQGDFYLIKINGVFDGENIISGTFGSDNRGPVLTDIILERRDPALPGVKMLLLDE
ncbi:hypothetical protein [Desulfonatronum sp. SC1]|uniref:hypothetical protein n=1 Tax=Desulfonatronum sp. SC1 TaxID=2109626 RepID=UPI0011B1F2E8|nr:hypothetical protein [Desulfonatronum sp. SC1]